MATSLLQLATTTTTHLRTDRKHMAERIARCASAALALLAVSTLTGICQGPGANDSKQVKLVADYGKTPMSFELNRGQTDPRVQFFSRGQGYGIFLTPGEAVLSLQQPSPKAGNSAKPQAPESSILRMTLVGADEKATASPQDQLPGTSNYFFGSDAKKWATDVPTYGKVQFRGVYPGVDLVYYGNQRQLEYDFVVAPNADARQIALSFSGAAPKLNASGDLLLATPGGETSFHKPVVYQRAGDTKVAVDAGYVVAKQRVTFSLGSYDHSKPLIIDPVLSYGTFLGGSLDDRGFGVQVDAAGNAYLVGDTVSLNFPLVNAFQSTNHDTSNGWVVYVTKLNPTGTALLYSTFLGGVADSHGLGIAVDSAGSAYVAGYTGAGDYPVTSGAFQTVCGSNWAIVNNVATRINGCGPSSGTSAFLTKLAPSGNSLVYSTFLSGNYFSQATSVAVDSAGEAYIAGNTNSSCGPGPYYPAPFSEFVTDCFPTTSGALQTQLNGGYAPGGQTWGFLTKFSANGSAQLYSTLFASPISLAPIGDTIFGLALDSSDNAYITGVAGYGLPTSPNAFYVPPAYSTTALPPVAAFVAKFNPSLSGAAALVYNTYLGSAVQTANAAGYNNTGTSIAVDASDDAIVVGYTDICGYPTTVGAYQPSFPTSGNGGTTCNDGFVTKVNPTGTGLVWSTLLGSGRNTVTTNTTANSVMIGPTGNIYVALNAGGATFPLVHPLRTAASGGSVIAELDPTGSNLLFSSYLGSFGTSGYGGTDVATGVAVDPAGNMYITGRMDANTLTIPTTPGALQTTYQGGVYDAFVLKVAPTVVSTTTLALPTGTVTAGQSATFAATVAGPTGTTTVPTGTVTFLFGSTALGTATLNASGVATYTASSLNGTTYTVTASYSGDTNFSASVSSASTLVVAPATPTIKLTAPATANVGASVTLSVAITGTAGTPTGTVVFKDGTTTLSTMTLASGAASYSTSSLAVGAHSITASYSGDVVFASAVSSAQTVTISVAPALTFAAVPTTLTITHGSSGTVVVTGTPVGGYSGTATFTCGALPTAAACTFSPASLAFSGNNTAQSTTLTISTSTTTAKLEQLPGRNIAPGIFFAMLFPLGLVWRRCRKVGGFANLTLLALLVAASCVPFIGLVGCSSGSSAPAVVTTPVGAYSITVTVTAPSANGTITLPITVQ
jgi:hypothetical protein